MTVYLDKLNSYFKKSLFFDPGLDPAVIDPFMANGLLVRGKEKISKIGFGVSASMELFRKAYRAGCDCLVVHHVFNFPPHARYDKIFQDRMGYLVTKGISLFGFHFLLDAHPVLGNNAVILKTIGAKLIEPYLHGKYPWGWQGFFEKGARYQDVKEILKKYSSEKTVMYNFGPEVIKKVIAVSGKGSPYFSGMQELIDQGVDLYITGETHEWIRELFREAGINFIAFGHYNSERFGVKALMEKFSLDHLQAETVWLELANEV